jgi:hypothetical protein
LITTNLFVCNGYNQFDDNVCSGNGGCLYNKCLCYVNYNGDSCNMTTCYGFNQTGFKVCSGHGECVDYNNCLCESLYFGDNCDKSYIFTLIIPMFFVLLIIVVILICSILIFFTSIIIILFIYFYRKQNKFILKNKELTEKLFLMNDLNKIDINKIKFDKNNGKIVVIGKGTSSKVYSGKYNSINVAIKEVDSDEYGDSLISEIIFLKNIDHQNIIKYFGYSINTNGNFLVLTGKFYYYYRINEKWLTFRLFKWKKIFNFKTKILYYFRYL